jgi:hypothetical protein
MAVLTKSPIASTDLIKVLAFTASSGSDTVALTGADDNMRIIINNANATAGQIATVTIKAGTGLLSSQGDVVMTVPISTISTVSIVNISSARIKKISDGTITILVSVAAAGVVGSVTIAIVEVL